jgi:hypothetical protein
MITFLLISNILLYFLISDSKVESSFPPELATHLGSSQNSLFAEEGVATSDYVQELLASEDNHHFASKATEHEAILLTTGGVKMRKQLMLMQRSWTCLSGSRITLFFLMRSPHLVVTSMDPR